MRKTLLTIALALAAVAAVPQSTGLAYIYAGGTFQPAVSTSSEGATSFTPQAISMYCQFQGTATFTNGSASIGATNSFTAGTAVQILTTGALPTGFETNQIYWVLTTGLTTSAFEVSLTPAGAAIVAGSAGSGTQTVTATVPATSSCFGGGGGGGTAFSAITGGTNTLAAMLVGTGASLGATGSGAINATAVPAAGVVVGALSGVAAITSATSTTLNATVGLNIVTMTTSVTSSTIAPGVNGQVVCFAIEQVGGSFPWVWPSNMFGMSEAVQGTNDTTYQCAVYLSVLSEWLAIGPATRSDGEITTPLNLTVNDLTVNGDCDGCGGVTGVTGTAPVASSGGATPVISMHVADASDDGYLASADWSTFNSKQPALSLLPGTYTNGDWCSYATTGTLLNCNNAAPQAALGYTPANAAATQTWSALQGFNNGDLGLNGSSSGQTVVKTAAVGSGTDVLPAAVNSPAMIPQVICAPTLALATSLISSGLCQTVTTGSVNSVACTNAVTTDIIDWTPAVSLQGVTNYGVSTSGALSIDVYPTAGYLNVNVCNWTAGSLTPGALTLNMRIMR
jgi:hypothetical protein